MHPHSPPSLSPSIMLPMNVLLLALISLQTRHSYSTVFLSIYIYNGVYALLPIMLSISVVLLLAGWKGVRGGLSQLIYHIKYHPSSTFSSLPHSPISLLTFSLLSLFFSPLLTMFICYLSSLRFCHFWFPLTLRLSCPHKSPSEPLSTSPKVPIAVFF